MIRYDTIRYDTIRYDTIRYDTIRYDTIRYDTIRYDTIRYDILFSISCSLHNVYIIRMHTYIHSITNKLINKGDEIDGPA